VPQYEFEDISDSQVAGITLRSKKGTGTLETGVYLPPAHQPNALGLNVVLWLHGFYVNNIQDLFNPDPDLEPRIRQSVLASGKDVVLIAPHMGYGDRGHPLKPGGLVKGTGSQTYLLDVLAGLGRYLKARFGAAGPHGTIDIDKFMTTNPNWLREEMPLHRLDILNLFVACHSGGGYGAMIPLLETLGRFGAPVLKACWGFDCMYGGFSDLWEPFCQGHQNIDHYYYHGDGTKGPESRKLIFEFTRAVYGAPKFPKRDHLHRVHLAAGFDGVELDRVAFMPAEDVQKAPKPLPTVYGQMRELLDPLLGGTQDAYWEAFFGRKGPARRLWEHFEIPARLLQPRIERALP
jgi:hypothetical protein